MIEHVNELAIVFISKDQDNVIYEEYYASMPWCSLPYDKQQTNVHALGTTHATIYMYACVYVCIYMHIHTYIILVQLACFTYSIYVKLLLLALSYYIW